jgi:hypothetical protein
MKRNFTSSVSQAINITMASYQHNMPLIQKAKPEAFTIKIASTIEERDAVFRLAYQVYLDKNYVKKNANEWLVNDYDRSKSTTIFMVKDHLDSIVASATLVFNDNSILPTESIYAKEIENLKISGSKIVEVSRLVISPDFRNSREILVLLFNYMFVYGFHVKHFDTTIIQVNPRHKDYYRKLLNFQEIGEVKFGPIVQNAPAILLCLPLKSCYAEVIRYGKITDIEKKDRSLYPHFLNVEQEKLVAHYLEKQAKPISDEEKKYFGFFESEFTKTYLPFVGK